MALHNSCAFEVSFKFHPCTVERYERWITGTIPVEQLGRNDSRS